MLRVVKMMNIDKKQFDVLKLLENQKSQRKIAEETKYSLGTVNKILKELSILNLITDSVMNENGRKILEQYRVRRAVFLAAGFGERLVPITLNTPKPLIRVNGKRIIDGLIDACLAVGIEEIYIVRGYLAEEFDQLLYKYPMVKFLENPLFNETNNISSSMCARYLLSNSYVFEADLIINPKIIQKYHYTSNFLAIKKERTDDWCFEVDKDNYITKEKFGGFNCYQMVGISYWNKEDGERLKEDIKTVYEMPGGKERYWEQVPLMDFKYKVQVIECNEEDAIEIDTLKELRAIDKSYEM